MDNVIPLRESDVSPQYVLYEAQKSAMDFCHAIVVMVDKDGGYVLYGTQMDSIVMSYICKIVDARCVNVMRKGGK